MEIVAQRQLFAKFSPVYLETSPFIPSDFKLVLNAVVIMTRPTRRYMTSPSIIMIPRSAGCRALADKSTFGTFTQLIMPQGSITHS